MKLLFQSFSPLKLKFQAKETNLELTSKRERRGDNKNAITVLSRTAVTPLLTYIQRFKCKYVTGDSKYSFYNSYVEPYLSKFSTSSFERATS